MVDREHIYYTVDNELYDLIIKCVREHTAENTDGLDEILNKRYFNPDMSDCINCIAKLVSDLVDKVEERREEMNEE